MGQLRLTESKGLIQSQPPLEAGTTKNSESKTSNTTIKGGHSHSKVSSSPIHPGPSKTKFHRPLFTQGSLKSSDHNPTAQLPKRPHPLPAKLPYSSWQERSPHPQLGLNKRPSDITSCGRLQNSPGLPTSNHKVPGHAGPSQQGYPAQGALHTLKQLKQKPRSRKAPFFPPRQTAWPHHPGLPGLEAPSLIAPAPAPAPAPTPWSLGRGQPAG